MSDTNPPKPMLAKTADVTGTGAAASGTRPKTEVDTERPPQLDMESARALARRIRAKIEGRPRVEDSTAIIRQFRNADRRFFNALSGGPLADSILWIEDVPSAI